MFRSFLFKAPSVVSSLSSFSKTQLSRMSTLDNLNFDNRILRELPVDKEKRKHVRTVSGACYSVVNPTPLKNPCLVSVSVDALQLLGLNMDEIHKPEFVQYFSGNSILPGSQPAAHCYCGHQFGHFSGQLGDGCALYLGEVVNDKGERWELQLKGSGKTPYSRHADGRKVLRSSIREFLCSEAMYYLGIPTTRAGSCITSDTFVERDIFYNGNNIRERATVITRIAPTFIRFGSFEIFKTRDLVTGRTGPSVGHIDIFNQLLDYVIRNYYPEIYSSVDESKRVSSFFHELCRRTARLVALWQCVGFCHGVLNTDNMSIVGVTIDYGPFGFLDSYNPGHVCNGSDDCGRYTYGKQHLICGWNLEKLSEALLPSLSTDDAKKGLEMYYDEFKVTYLSKMREKLGLVQKSFPEDIDLIEKFLETLHVTGCDFTNGFRNLNAVNLLELNNPEHVGFVCNILLKECATPDELVKSYKPMIPLHQLRMFATLQEQSPMILLQLGLSSELIQNEMQKIRITEKIENTPLQEKQEADRMLWSTWLSSYASRLEKEIEGVSDESIKLMQVERTCVMNNANPKFILRNHIAQEAIALAENGDYSEVDRVLKLLQTPYSDECLLENYESGSSQEQTDMDSFIAKYFCRPPISALGLNVT